MVQKKFISLLRKKNSFENFQRTKKFSPFEKNKILLLTSTGLLSCKDNERDQSNFFFTKKTLFLSQKFKQN